MMGGYLERIVESGMTSLRQVRGSIRGAPPQSDIEEQHAVAPVAPFSRDAHDETPPDPARAWPAPLADVQWDPPRNRATSVPPEMTSAQRDAVSRDVAATDGKPLARPAQDAASADIGRLEERRSHDTAPAMPPDARGTGAHAPLLKDAGIRRVLSRDEAPAAQGATRQRTALFDATARPLGRVGVEDGDGERPPRRFAVPAARVEQWQRLKDKLLLEHAPGTSRSNVAVAADEHPASQPTNRRFGAAPGEIVIEQLEVVVAAPDPAPPAPPGPSSHSPRSGAWSVATRRYLGRL